MGDGVHEGRVGSRADGQPLVRVSGARLVQAVVDVDDLRTGLAHLREVVDDVGAAHARVGRAVAEHDDQVGLLGLRHGRGVHAVIGVAAVAVGVGHAGLHHVRGIVGVALQVAAHQVRKAREQAACGGGNAAAVVHVHGLVAVLVDGVLERVGDALVCLVPADLLELALAALALALHGLHEAVGRVDPAADGAAAQAGTGLQPGGIAHVVRFGVDDLAVLHVPAQQARAAAVDDALAVDDLVSRRGAPVLGAFLALGGAAVQRASGGPGQREPGERALHERAARQRRCFVHCHGFPPSPW